MATLNVRGLCSRKRQHHFQRLLLDESPDILAVQESKLSTEAQVDEALLPLLGSYEVCVSHSIGPSAGCLMFLKKQLPLSELTLSIDQCGRFIMCDFVLFGEDWRVVCVYAPRTVRERVDFFCQLLPFCDCDRNVVVLGDFNCVCYCDDRAGVGTSIDRSARLLNNLVDNCDLVDVGKYNSKERPLQFTHFQGTSHARLDRIYIKVSLTRHVTSYKVKPVFFSDHCIVTATLGRRTTKAHKFDWQQWKMNVTFERWPV